MSKFKQLKETFGLNVGEEDFIESTQLTAEPEDIEPVLDVKADPKREEHMKPISLDTPIEQHDDGVNRIITIHPQNYNEAEKIGMSFRQGIPVIMNLDQMNDSDARRLIDFAAGLVYALQGNLEKITNRAFLLSPKQVRIEKVSGVGGVGSSSNIFNKI